MSGTEGSTHPPSSGESGANVEIGARLYGSINAELKVRIRFPPAESRVNFRECPHQLLLAVRQPQVRRRHQRRIADHLGPAGPACPAQRPQPDPGPAGRGRGHFQWHEVNGQHAFLRDEGARYDPALAYLCYGLVFGLFHRRLG
jgi:hypothetical protein